MRFPKLFAAALLLVPFSAHAANVSAVNLSRKVCGPDYTEKLAQNGILLGIHDAYINDDNNTFNFAFAGVSKRYTLRVQMPNDEAFTWSLRMGTSTGNLFAYLEKINGETGLTIYGYLDMGNANQAEVNDTCRALTVAQSVDDLPHTYMPAQAWDFVRQSR